MASATQPILNHLTPLTQLNFDLGFDFSAFSFQRQDPMVSVWSSSQDLHVITTFFLSLVTSHSSLPWNSLDFKLWWQRLYNFLLPAPLLVEFSFPALLQVKCLVTFQIILFLLVLLFLQNISPPEVSQLWLCFLFWCTNYDKWVTVRMHKATQCDDGKRKEILGDVYVATDKLKNPKPPEHNFSKATDQASGTAKTSVWPKLWEEPLHCITLSMQSFASVFKEFRDPRLKTFAVKYKHCSLSAQSTLS